MTYCRDPIRLQHMLNYASEVLELTKGRSRSDLKADRSLGLAVGRLLELIGAEAAGVSPDYQTTYTAIHWAQLISLGNLRSSGYEGMDREWLWKFLSQDLPALVQELERIILRLSLT